MNFKRPLTTSRPLPQGYFATSTEDVNTDKAYFKIGSKIRVTEQIDQDLPKRLKVQARLVPLIYSPEQILTASLTSQHQHWHPYRLYQKDRLMERYSCLSALEIHLERLLTPNIPEAPLEIFPQVYRKEFSVQTTGPCTLIHEVREGKPVMVPPGIPGKQPLWSYGGYYQLGCNLHEIEQILFTPSREQDKTILQLSRISSWHTKNHEIVFIDPLEDKQKLTLVGEIEKGHISFHWFQGVDEQGEVHQTCYRSFAIHQQDRLSEVVEIEFQKEETTCVGK